MTNRIYNYIFAIPLIYLAMTSYGDWVKKPTHISVNKSDIPEVNFVLNKIDKDCDGCLYKKGIYNVNVKVNSVSKYNKDENKALGVSFMYLTHCKIVISPAFFKWTDREKYMVLLHELGHCAGFSHDASETSLMSPYSDPIPDSEIDHFLWHMKGHSVDE